MTGGVMSPPTIPQAQGLLHVPTWKVTAYMAKDGGEGMKSLGGQREA